MLLAAHESGSGTFLTGPGLVVAFTIFSALATATTVVLQYISMHPKRKIITLGMLATARIVERSVPLPHLHIHYGNEELTDAHVSTIALTYRGNEDLRIKSFEGGQPFGINVGSRIIDLLGKKFDPAQAPVPPVKAVEARLDVGPSLVRNGQEMTFLILTDGPCALSHVNPLAGVKVRPGVGYQAREDPRESRRQTRRIRWAPIAAWAIVSFLAFYVATEPTGAAHVFNDIGNALANFFNSL